VVVVVALVGGFVFGAGDQYLGSLVTLGAWTAAASLLSAPWLVVPFALGCTQTRVVRAASLGLLATMSALAGYVVMLLSPLEGARLSLHGVGAWLASSGWIVIGGVVTGPVFGFLGQRWRTRRAWLSAALVAGALCLEPFAERVAGRSWSPTVALVEVAVGAVLAVYFLVSGTSYRRGGSRSLRGVGSG
jgi:Family of unknown function (DUF6518)